MMIAMVKSMKVTTMAMGITKHREIAMTTIRLYHQVLQKLPMGMMITVMVKSTKVPSIGTTMEMDFVPLLRVKIP